MLQPPSTHLAQINVGRARHALDDPRMAEFMGALNRINALAERSAGFVWRLKDDAGNATGIKVSDDPLFIINMSVWASAAEFEHFVWATVHKRFYAKKANWFDPHAEPHFAMWWVPAGHEPTPAEGLERLALLRRDGPGEHAFGWERLPNLTTWLQQRCA